MDLLLETQELVTENGRHWESVLQRAIRSIFSIRVSAVRNFDTEVAGISNATGFVVDSKLGIILTNRHVVSSGPITAFGVLSNYEEVELIPMYRDPVHDFGFFKFNVNDVSFIKIDEIPLSPDHAMIGIDIRVVGNDANEKLSILSGTLARMDRKAPDYGAGEYNDINTFYFQAASGTSGGSSGSPVLDIHGHAIALNAGGATKASSSYYLPLDRVKRALSLLQQGLPVPRGTLQTEFEHLPYDQLRRLGLPLEIETLVRSQFPNETGMLTIKSRLPKGPADGILVPGDIILKLQGEIITTFLEIDTALDNSVNKELKLTVQRGREMLDFTITVQDLHSITPDRFVEIGGSVVHSLSYQMARPFSLPVGSVFIASPGHLFISSHICRNNIVVSVNHIATPTLDDFVNACKNIPDGARFPAKVHDVSKPYRDRIEVCYMERHWHGFKSFVRNDHLGLWDCTELQAPPSKMNFEPCTALFPVFNNAIISRLFPSLVTVETHLPFVINGQRSLNFKGLGYIVNTTHGFLLCDRSTVPAAVADIFLTFANSITIPGQVFYMHPTYNIVVVKYEPGLLGNTKVSALEIADESLEQGDVCYLSYLTSDDHPVVRRTVVSNIDSIATVEFCPPRWRSMNSESIQLEEPTAESGGLISDEYGRVFAFWLRYFTYSCRKLEDEFMSGLQLNLLKPFLAALIHKKVPVTKLIDAEFETVRVSSARSLGLSEEWVQGLENSSDQRTLLSVKQIFSQQSELMDHMKAGDILLEMNNKVVTKMRDLYVDCDVVQMTVLRDRKEISLSTPTIESRGENTDCIVAWAGLIVQDAYKAVYEQTQNAPRGVYVACFIFGSPAVNYGLRPGVWITEIDGAAVPNLVTFIDIVKTLKGTHKYVRMKTVNRQDVIRVVCIKPDDHYFAPWQIVRSDTTDCGWVMETL